MSMGHLYALTGEVSIQALCPFFSWIVCLPGVESYEFFIYFGDQTLVQCIIGKYIFPYSQFPFHFDDRRGLSEWVSLINQQTTSAGEDVEKREP